MQISYNLPHVFARESSPLDNVDVLRALFDCLIILRDATTCTLYLNGESIPSDIPLPKGVKTSRAKNKPEAVFDLPKCFHADSDAVVNAKCIRALLDCLERINRLFCLRYRTIPLYESRVYYKRTVVWDSIPALGMRGYGDCKTLAPALAAQLQLQGVDCTSVFRFLPKGDQTLFHVLVQIGSEFEDPSKRLGMPDTEPTAQ